MQTVSTALKNVLKSNAIQGYGYVVLYDITLSTNQTIYGADIAKIEISSSACLNNRVLGSLARGELKIEFIGDFTQELDLTHVYEIKPSLGAYLTSSTTEVVAYQKFMVSKIEYVKSSDRTMITAYDYAYKFDKTFVDTNTYPMTLYAFLQDVCSQAGVTLTTGSIFNGSYSVATKPVFDDNTLADVLYRVLEMSLSMAYINRSDGLAIKKLSDLDSTTFVETLDVNTITDLSVSQDSFKTLGINTVVLKLDNVVEGENVSASDATMVSTDGNVELTIVGNPFIWNETLKNSVITGMLAEIKGFKYKAFKITSALAPYFDLGDIIKIKPTTSAADDFITTLLSYNIKFDGALSCDIESSAFSLVDTAYKNEGSLTKRVKRTEIMVDKLAGTITLEAANQVSILVGNLYKGGNNLIKSSQGFGSTFLSSGSLYSISTTPLTDHLGNLSKTALAIVFSSSTPLTSYFKIDGIIKKTNTQYVFSCWITRLANVSYEYKFYSGASDTLLKTVSTTPNEWTYVEFTFTSDADISTYNFIRIRANVPNANTLYMMYPMFEEGSVATEWLPESASEVVGAKYIFDGDKARFYSDGQEWYDDSGVLQVYFDTVNHRYVFKGRIESSSGLIGGWNISSTQIYKNGVILDSTNERIYVGNSAYLYSYGSGVLGLSGNLRVTGTITVLNSLSSPTIGCTTLIVEFGGTQYTLTRDSSGYVRALV